MTYKINKKAKINMIELYPTYTGWEFPRWYKNAALIWTSKKTSGNDSVSYDANGLITLSPQYSYMIKYPGFNYPNSYVNYTFDFMYEDNTKVEGANVAQTKAEFLRSLDHQNANEGSVLLIKHPTKRIKLVLTETTSAYSYILGGFNINIMEFCL